MTERERILAAIDAVFCGERIALLVGDGSRPVEIALTAGEQARLRRLLKQELSILHAALGPDEDGYFAPADAAASYDEAIRARREREGGQ